MRDLVKNSKESSPCAHNAHKTSDENSNNTNEGKHHYLINGVIYLIIFSGCVSAIHQRGKEQDGVK
jgi:hypothetical protein